LTKVVERQCLLLVPSEILLKVTLNCEISFSHIWDRPVPIFNDVRFSYLALVQDKKKHVRFTGKCMPYSLCQLPPQFSMLFLFKIVSELNDMSSADCCFSELALLKSNWSCWSSTKRTSSSSCHRNTTGFGPPITSIMLYHVEMLMMCVQKRSSKY
jgi:hypothetical protein